MLIDPKLTGVARQSHAATLLIEATVEIAEGGVPLMRRVVPENVEHEVWRRYPTDDAVDAWTGARWFYHAHPPEERDADEHGHFHLFLDKGSFGRGTKLIAGPVDSSVPRADVVHIVALSIDLRGVPTRIFTVNRWVTDEWLYAAEDVLARLEQFDLSEAPGDPLVNRWLTAAVAALQPEIRVAMRTRDAMIGTRSPTDPLFEDRETEVMSVVDVDLQRVIEEPDRAASTIHPVSFASGD